MLVPSEAFKRGNNGIGKVPGGDPETHVVAFGQCSQQVGRTAERHFRVGRVGAKQRQQTPISRNHLLDRRVRSSQLRENKFQGHSDQRKTRFIGRHRKSELTENDAV